MTTVPSNQQLPHDQRRNLDQRDEQSPQQQLSQYGLHSRLDAATYDPDEVVPRNSPLMTPVHPRLEPTPSPPLDIPPHQVGLPPLLRHGNDKSNRQKIRQVSGDAVLINFLDGGRRPEIAQVAGKQALPHAASDDDDDNDDSEDNDASLHDDPRADHYRTDGARNFPPRSEDLMTKTNALQAVAHDVLQAIVVEPCRQLDIATSADRLSLQDKTRPTVVNLDRPHRELPLPTSVAAAVARTLPESTALSSPGELPLPPLQIDSPKSNGNLPSLRSIYGNFDNLDRLKAEPPTPSERERPIHLPGPGQIFPAPSTAGTPRYHHMPIGSHASPPISPNENYQRSLPSPHSLPSASPFYHHNRQNVEYTSSVSNEKFKPNLTPHPPAPVAITNRMSIDGITNPQVATYACTVAGCNAPPFQTQYLLNSHANVHSSSRPHYCPVQGCPRGEGGKGFKRKNEMIRHGLVHDSPGYVCPFCANREHRYPRPDNLQRHVRQHHVDKDKDDPLLRNVLSQRPDGPNRSRRKRGAPP